MAVAILTGSRLLSDCARLLLSMQASTRAAEGGRETELPSSVQNYKETVHKFYLMTYQIDFFRYREDCVLYFSTRLAVT